MQNEALRTRKRTLATLGADNIRCNAKNKKDEQPRPQQTSCQFNRVTCILLTSWYKNVDIKFSAHDAFLKKPSPGTLNNERLESQII
jgi:hypothetical protein